MRVRLPKTRLSLSLAPLGIALVFLGLASIGIVAQTVQVSRNAKAGGEAQTLNESTSLGRILEARHASILRSRDRLELTRSSRLGDSQFYTPLRTPPTRNRAVVGSWRPFAFDPYNSSAGYVSQSNPWGTADSAFFPNGITTAGSTNWVYGSTTFIGNAPSNGFGHQFEASNGASRALLAIGGGNVGIGTISPQAILSVKVPFAATGNTGTILAGQADSTIVASIATYVEDVSTGATALTFNTLLGNAGLTEKLRITNSGNVGIGTTSPTARLTVSGSSIDNGSTGIDFTNTTGNDTFRLAAGVPGVTNSNFSISQGGTAEVVIANGSGNVGIGTASPQGKLHVKAGTDRNIWLRDGGSAQKAQIIAVADDNGTVSTLSIDGSHLLLNSQSTGNVGIGTTNPQYKLDVAGTINSNSTITGTNIVAKYQDVAEWVPTSQQMSTGTVVVLDATKSNHVITSTQAYDTRVAGVVSAQPGLALGESAANKVLVATTGRVLVNVDATNGPIHIGDLLVTSDIPGLAMKSEPISIGDRKMHMPGTLIGKALEPLEKGSGKILVLLSLQ